MSSTTVLRSYAYYEQWLDVDACDHLECVVTLLEVDIQRIHDRRCVIARQMCLLRQVIRSAGLTPYSHPAVFDRLWHLEYQHHMLYRRLGYYLVVRDLLNDLIGMNDLSRLPQVLAYRHSASLRYRERAAQYYD